MNTIVHKHFPVAKLPAELRGNIPSDALVEIQIVEETSVKRSAAELVEMARSLPASSATVNEAVQRIRELRDEWDD